jgi:hypothetical protein
MPFQSPRSWGHAFRISRIYNCLIMTNSDLDEFEDNTEKTLRNVLLNFARDHANVGMTIIRKNGTLESEQIAD